MRKGKVLTASSYCPCVFPGRNDTLTSSSPPPLTPIMCPAGPRPGAGSGGGADGGRGANAIDPGPFISPCGSSIPQAVPAAFGKKRELGEEDDEDGEGDEASAVSL